jgi:hypothetical protein
MYRDNRERFYYIKPSYSAGEETGFVQMGWSIFLTNQPV